MASELGRLFTTQGGVVRMSDAREHLMWRRLREYQDLGFLIRESRNVVRVSTARDTLVDRIRRVEVHLRRPVIACDHTAAMLHGFGVIDDGRVHITTPSGQSADAPTGVVVHQTRPRSPTTVVDGITCTDPADTAVDLARLGPAIDVLAVLDAALRSGVAEHDLRRALDGAGRRRGIITVRELAPHASPLAESPMESRTRFRVLEAGLPAPELQVWVQTDDGNEYRLDMLYRAARLGLEFDGEDFHTGDGSLRRDRGRQSSLLASDYLCLHVTSPDVYRGHAQFTATLRRLLDQRLR